VFARENKHKRDRRTNSSTARSSRAASKGRHSYNTRCRDQEKKKEDQAGANSSISNKCGKSHPLSTEGKADQAPERKKGCGWAQNLVSASCREKDTHVTLLTEGRPRPGRFLGGEKG